MFKKLTFFLDNEIIVENNQKKFGQFLNNIEFKMCNSRYRQEKVGNTFFLKSSQILMKWPQERKL